MCTYRTWRHRQYLTKRQLAHTKEREEYREREFHCAGGKEVTRNRLTPSGEWRVLEYFLQGRYSGTQLLSFYLLLV